MSVIQRSSMSGDEAPASADQIVQELQLSESHPTKLCTADAACQPRLPSAPMSNSQVQSHSGGSSDEDHQATQSGLVLHARQASVAAPSPGGNDTINEFNDAVNRYTLSCFFSNILSLVGCGALDKAEQEALKALDFCTKSSNEVGIARCKFWLGKIAFDRKDWKVAHQLFMEAMPCVGKCREGDDVSEFLRISNPTKTDKERVRIIRKRKGELHQASSRLSAPPQPKPVIIHHEQRQERSHGTKTDEQHQRARATRDSKKKPSHAQSTKKSRQEHLDVLKKYGDALRDSDLVATGHRVSYIMGLRRITTSWGGQVFATRCIRPPARDNTSETKPSIDRHSAVKRGRSGTLRRKATPDARQSSRSNQREFEFTFQCDLSGGDTLSSESGGRQSQDTSRPQPPPEWKAVEKRVRSRSMTRKAWMHEKDNLRKRVLVREFYRSNQTR